MEISQLLGLSILTLGILLISTLWKYKKLVVIGFCLFFLVLGIWLQQKAELKIINNELRKYNDKEETITLTGVVVKEPDVRETNTKLTLGKVELLGKFSRVVEEDKSSSSPFANARVREGRILLTTKKYPEYKYGDKLKIKGKLQTPQEFEDFNYKNYLAKDGIYSVIYYPEIELLPKEKSIGPTHVIYGKIFEIKNKLREVIYQNLSPPQSSILGAIILGDKRQISQEWKDKLNYAGVRHLTAVSGMHVAILTAILMSLLISLGLWRQQAFFGALILMAVFIVMTGFQPSAIRAGIMVGVFLISQYLGRESQSSRALVMAAAIMLFQNPLLLKLDVGFQLSFLAVMGIIYLMPHFQKYFGNIIAMTLSAQVFTLPILIYNFGYFSLVAPLTNILIVPLLPFIIGFGFIFAISGIIWQSLGYLLSFPAWALLTYLTKIVDWFSGFSFSTYFLEISWYFLAVFYLVLGLIVWQLNKKQKLKILKF